jgi:hypothetical protein
MICGGEFDMQKSKKEWLEKQTLALADPDAWERAQATAHAGYDRPARCTSRPSASSAVWMRTSGVA